MAIMMLTKETTWQESIAVARWFCGVILLQKFFEIDCVEFQKS